MEYFINPWSMALGGLLVASPIVIHLINRMRYKRVRWAAMEFLLKSQKRSKRKMVVEQMILLLLRILLVLLLGLLLARFLGFKSVGGGEAQSTLHVIVLDDTPSMGDFWKEEGQDRNTFAEAKRLLEQKIAADLLKAPTAQYLKLALLSDLDNVRDFDRVNPDAVEKLKAFLGPVRPSPVSVPLAEGLKAAKKIFDDAPKAKHVLHVVGDFRQNDWGPGAEKGLTDAFAEVKPGADIYLLDAAHPERTEKQKTPLYHDNIAIVDLRSETRIAAKYAPVEFTVTVANYSGSEKKNVKVSTRLNGSDRAEGSVNIPSLPPNELTTARFTLAFDRVGTEENPRDRFSAVSAHIEKEPAGLFADNVRSTVIEVRDRVPLLLVDANPPARGKKESETFYLQKLFTEPIKGYDVQIKSPSDLENLNLQPYIGVIVCDVPRFSDKALANLQSYVRSGGGAAFFMGPSIKPNDIKEFYNAKLWNEGTGLFPAPLDELPEGFTLAEADREKNRLSRLFSLRPQIYPRDDRHPALERLYTDSRGVRVNPEEYNRFLLFPVIDRYFKVRRAAWDTRDQSVQELMTLPNFQTMDKYTAAVNKLMARLPKDEEKLAKYKDVLRKYFDEIRNAANDPSAPLSKLALLLENLLQDDGDKDANRPSLRELWQTPEQAELARDIRVQLDIVKYGDPLYMAKQVGNGRVLAFTTGAGSAWNDHDGFGRYYFPQLMIELQHYLASAGTDLNLTLGRGHEFIFDGQNYGNRAKKWYLGPEAESAAGDDAPKPTAFTSLGEQSLTGDKGKLSLNFTEARRPGAYIFEFAEQRVGGAAKEPVVRADYRAVAYNMDARAESDLKRADTAQIETIAKGAKLYTASSDEYSEALRARKTDLSESPWIYLVIILALTFEQYMAVRLSFHARGGADAVPLGRGAVARAA